MTSVISDIIFYTTFQRILILKYSALSWVDANMNEQTFPPNNLPSLSPSSASMITSILGILGLLYILYTREATPLRNVPGPFLASITKLWVFKKQRDFKRPFVDMGLHQKYGPIVRIAPNEVLVSSPKSFRTIYGMISLFPYGLGQD